MSARASSRAILVRSTHFKTRTTAMKIRNALLPLALALSLPAVADATRGFEVRDMAYLDRHSSPTLSPDGRVLVFAKRVVDKGTNKSSTSLWTRNLLTRDLRPPSRLTPEGWNVNSPSFSADGKTVYFMSGKSGSMQLYSMPLAGGEPTRLTDYALDVDAYKLSPDGTQVALAFAVFPDCKADLDCTKKKLDDVDALKTSGKVFDRMFIRHWDTWNDGRLNRVFAAKLGGAGMLKSATLLSGDIAGDIPSKPFGDLSDFAWSADGKRVAMSVRQANREEPWSTNFDLWLVNAADGSGARNLTAEEQGLGCRPGVQRRRQDALLPRDGAPGLRGRPLRADGDGPCLRSVQGNRAEVGCVRRWHHPVRRRQVDLHHRAGELGRHPLFRVRWPMAKWRAWSRTAACRRSTWPGRRWRSRATR
jgi:dipeptidyl aminopeptidase/acylaminoacyl peptidase